jgi:hypothetical protein
MLVKMYYEDFFAIESRIFWSNDLIIGLCELTKRSI